MVSTTFFGNRARAYVLETITATTVTLTNGSTSYTGIGAVAGDYIWCTVSGQQYAARVSAPGTLAYTYKGPSVVAQPGYYSTPTPFVVLRGLTVDFSWDVSELYGTDSIGRVDEARHNLKITHSTRYSKWDSNIAVDWVRKIVSPTTGTTAPVQDTNVAYLTGAVYVMAGPPGGNMDFVLGDCYYEGLPYPFPENDFIVRELKGYAKSGSINNY